MRMVRRVVLAAGLLASLSLAAVKALSLSELMEITSDVAHVRITAKASVQADYPYEGCVWTKLSVQGESLRTGEPVQTELLFLGSHDAGDRFTISEMPTLQDTRLGGDALVFFWKDPELLGGANRIFDLSGVYRVEKGFGEPVVVGKGEGFAWSENVKLTAARDQVRAAHHALAAKAAAGK
ncbi:MAG: hypothetical protein FJ296_00285 [Planctomycetes bacterium]|nr:hypothetical protein [Planctomycetota bacterium]